MDGINELGIHSLEGYLGPDIFVNANLDVGFSELMLEDAFIAKRILSVGYTVENEINVGIHLNKYKHYLVLATHDNLRSVRPSIYKNQFADVNPIQNSVENVLQPEQALNAVAYDSSNVTINDLYFEIQNLDGVSSHIFRDMKKNKSYKNFYYNEDNRNIVIK